MGRAISFRGITGTYTRKTLGSQYIILYSGVFHLGGLDGESHFRQAKKNVEKMSKKRHTCSLQMT